MSRETSLLPVTRREIVSWALYDFANSAFTTLIVTFIFSAYFAQSIAPDPIEGAIWWTRAVQTSAIIVAGVMPVLGAIADSGGLKKRLLFMHRWRVSFLLRLSSGWAPAMRGLQL